MQLKNIKSLCTGGYLEVYAIFNRFFNILLSVLLILLLLPFILIIALLIKTGDRGPIFFKGVRLGQNKKPFIMLKFRTLVEDADKIIGAEVLKQQVSAKYQLYTTMGRFLRDTRLDELPQLWNILKGDMDFIGPRPERPEIYEKICKTINDYDKRFIVKPGLIGYSQLFTPHTAPKRIRTLIDNGFLNIERNILWDIRMILYAFWALIKKLFQSIWRILWNNVVKVKILSIYQEKRFYERVNLKKARVYIGSKSDMKRGFFTENKLIDINEEAISVFLNEEIDPQDNLLLKLEVRYEVWQKRQKREKKKNAYCIGRIYHKMEMTDKPYRYRYVIKYTPLSLLNYYIIQKYFLRVSIS